jgi:hypothetical protein
LPVLVVIKKKHSLLAAPDGTLLLSDVFGLKKRPGRRFVVSHLLVSKRRKHEQRRQDGLRCRFCPIYPEYQTGGVNVTLKPKVIFCL